MSNVRWLVVRLVFKDDIDEDSKAVKPLLNQIMMYPLSCVYRPSNPAVHCFHEQSGFLPPSRMTVGFVGLGNLEYIRKRLNKCGLKN
jgi:hypothetical protein